MIWLWANFWWLAPLGIGLLALLHPATLLVLKRVPLKVWLALAVVALLGLSFQAGRWHERRAHRSAQEAAEARADAKAARVAKKATDAAKEATKRIEDRTEEAADDVQREMDSVGCDQPIPDVVRDELGDAVRRAREALQAG